MSTIPARAMVLAAGLGTRMRPLTESLPKPLIPVAGRPMIDRTLDALAVAGVETAVVNVCYLADLLITHLARHTRPSIVISREEEHLETGGGIARALPHFGSAPFLVVNGDVLWIDGPANTLTHLAAHWEEDLDALLLLARVEEAVGYDGPGDFFLDEAGGLRRRGEQARAPYVFCGVQILHPRLFAGAPGGRFSLNVLYNRAIGEDGTLRRIKGIAHNGVWLHVGDVAGLEAAESAFRTRALP